MPFIGVGAWTAAGTRFSSNHVATLPTLPAYYSTLPYSPL